MLWQYVPIILLAGGLAFLGTPLTRWLARSTGMLALPGTRKVHRSPVPLLGGMAMYAALVLVLVVFGQRDWLAEGGGILGGATLIFLTGLWDDRYGTPAWLRLLVEGVATACLIAVGIQVHLIGLNWLDAAITVAWVVGITNALNLMDNMDGLAAGLTAIGALFFLILAGSEGLGLVSSLAAALLGVAVGFLFYNTAPAVSYMGDAGALTLGFLLAVLGLKIKFIHLPLGTTWMVPIVVLGVLIFDTTLVTFSRWRRGRPIYQAGSDHTSHRLTQIGLSRPRAVLTLYVAAGTLGGIAVWLTRQPPLTANLVFAGLLGAGLLVLGLFERIEPQLAGDPPVIFIPAGGGDWTAEVQAALALSHDLTLLLVPQQFTAAEAARLLAALTEVPDAAQTLLARGLEPDWGRRLDGLGQILRLQGKIVAVTPEAEVQTVLQRARLVILGGGQPAVNLLPVVQVAAVQTGLNAGHADLVQIGPVPADWPAAVALQPLAVALADLPALAHKRLLAQAAGEAKSKR